MKEKPCQYCGAENTGGWLYMHKPNCSYVKKLADEYKAVRILLKMEDPS